MDHGSRHTVVSVSNLQARIDQWVNLKEPAQADTAKPGGNGKVEARHSRPDLNVPFQEPGSQTERRVAEIWEEMLGVSPIGVNDPFFELGGHSLLAIHLISRLREALRVDIPVQVLFETPTIAQLAVRVDEQIGDEEAPEPEEADETAEPEDEDADLEALLAQVENMSEEEVEKLLGDHTAPEAESVGAD